MFTDSGNEMVAVDLMKAGLTDYIVKSSRQLPRLRASLQLAVEQGRAKARETAREAELSAALAHEKVLVRELHHRVRNNLQLINSLLQLRAKASSDETAEQLHDLAGRMQALASVQMRIYETENLDRVDFRSALGDMADSLVSVHGDGHVRLVRDFDGPLTLNVGRAMPLGLLCYEFLLNALKHAWPLGASGTLHLIMRTTSDPVEICIGDDGKGYDQESATTGLGSRLIRALAAEARVEVSVTSRPNSGTRVELRLL
jgi:two-component sensor histidine kinase